VKTDIKGRKLTNISSRNTKQLTVLRNFLKEVVMENSDVVIVPLNEEFGYRLWYWVFPGSISELITEWKKGKAPINSSNPSKGEFKGTLMPVEKDFEEDFYNLFQNSDVKCHVFMDDTWLQINKLYFYQNTDWED
jgi:hypothetical protein